MVDVINGIVSCIVEKDRHCNMDSLPLRFGFQFQTDTQVELKVLNHQKSKKKTDRWEIDGQLVSPENGRLFSGTFILGKRPYDKTPVLVTAWRHDANEEFYLSNLITKLREKGLITSEWLIDHFELYDSGELRTADQLVKIFVKQAQENSKTEYQTALEEAIEGARHLALENEELLNTNNMLADELTEMDIDLKHSIAKNLEKEDIINQKNADLSVKKSEIDARDRTIAKKDNELAIKDKALLEKDLHIQQLQRRAHIEEANWAIVSRAPTTAIINEVSVTDEINRRGEAVKVINLHMSDNTTRRNNWQTGFEDRLKLARELRDEKVAVYTDVWNTKSKPHLYKYNQWFKNIYICD